MNPYPSNKSGRSRKDGFTIIELLAVIAIIAILAGILIVGVKRVRDAAGNTACMANLRQISNALLLYKGDHRGSLPGRIFPRQGPFFDRDERRLQNHLADYLGHTKSTSWTELSRADIWACGTWWNAIASDEIYSLAANQRVRHPTTGTLFDPWEKKELDMSGMGVPFATTWLIMEADQQLPVSDVRRMMPEPVHGGHRNAIFMDGHVRSIDVSESMIN